MFGGRWVALFMLVGEDSLPLPELATIFGGGVEQCSDSDSTKMENEIKLKRCALFCLEN